MAKAALYLLKLLGTCCSAYSCKMVLPGFIVIILACCVTSCKNGKHKNIISDTLPPAQRHIADSLQVAHDIDSADYGLLFKNKTNIWLYKMLLNKQNKWANFKLVDFWHKDSLKYYDYKPDTGFYKEYAMFLEWSPDSSYILDHGSYGVEMAKDDKGKYYVKSGDVDQEIAFLNHKAKTTARLLFFGPSTNAWGAHWVDSTQVALLGLDNPENGKHPDTLLWIYNLKNNLFRKYKYQRQQ